VNIEAAAADSDRLAAAHKALRADPSIQFDLTRPPPEPKPPPWLKAVLEWIGDALEPVGRFLSWIASFMPAAPIARIFLWAVLAGAALALLWALYARVAHGEWRLPRIGGRAIAEAEVEEPWSPEQTPVREWLREADALAEQGLYAQAIHHLLFRSIQDISRRRPDAVRAALTSREIGAADAIPPGARELFVRIARQVERSLFGGHAVEQSDWMSARTAYAEFALPQAWRA
jgi:hypothetical protein